MLLHLFAAAALGTQQAYVLSLFEPAIETSPSLSYEYWISGPTIDDLRAVAQRRRRDGEAGLRCSIAQDGQLKSCRVVNQLGGKAFGSAALRLSGKFLMKPDLVERARNVKASIYVELPFCVRPVCHPPEWPPYGNGPPAGM